MATQMSAYASVIGGKTGIRVAICEADPAHRAQLRAALDCDPLLILVGEFHNWTECETTFDEVIPDLVIARAEQIPIGWNELAIESIRPVVIALQTTLAFPGQECNLLRLPADLHSIRRCLDRAVREIYDRKAKQLRYFVERYVAGSQSLSPYKAFLQVERDGEAFDLHTQEIVSVVAARKHVSIHGLNRQFILREPIHRVSERLDPAVFVRIHRSIIINVRHIDRAAGLAASGSFVAMCDGSRYPVGPNYRDVLADALYRP